jgi:hypothetical protein
VTRAALAFLLLTPLAAFGQLTSPFTFYVHDTTGKLPDAVLPAAYQVPGTSVGGLSPTVLKMINTSANTIEFVLAAVSTGASSSAVNPNFSVTGQFQDLPLAPGGSVLFTVNFTPAATGVISGFLNVAFEIQQNGCSLSSSTNACPSNFVNISTLTGTATPPQLILSYTPPGGSATVLTPGSSSPLNFPNTSLGATSTFTFTITNPTTVNTSAPAISLPPVNQNAPSGFALDTSGVPSAIAAGQSANFTVTFAPSQIGLTSGVLEVGSNMYPIQGAAPVGQVISPFTFYVHDTTGKLPDAPLTAAYQVLGTSVGGLSPTVLKMVNTSANSAEFVLAVVSTGASSSAVNPNFSVTGQFQDLTLVAGGSSYFTINFTPTATGVISGFLNFAFEIPENGCSLSSLTCPGSFVNVSTLTGTATPPQLILSYTPPGGSSTVLTPGNKSPLNFPNISLSATSTFTFTITNPTTADTAAPAISLPPVNQNAPSAFALNTSSVPSVIPAGQSANFTVTFAPSQTGLTNGVLQVGSNTYPIQGAGIIVASIDSLQISYTDATGVRTLPQSATPISFAQVIPGGGTTSVLTFSVLNPTTSYNAVTISGIIISGASFSLSGLPPPPISIAPGSSITFQVSFTPTSSGSNTGSLAIGARQFVLNGLSVLSPVVAPSSTISLVLSGPLSSQQQATVTVQFSSPVLNAALGTISLQFSPTVASVTDDPAVMFLANGTRQLSIAVAANAQTATYTDKSGNSQSGIVFQTGSTAGTITFSVNFVNTPVYTQSFTIPAAAIQLTSAQALRQDPNLLITIDGYDNTYSAGQLSFTFYDTSGKTIGNPIQVNATSNFQQFFFSNANTGGGVFSLQASFPVTGGAITQVGSVAVGITSTAGQATTTATFQ